MACVGLSYIALNGGLVDNFINVVCGDAGLRSSARDI